MASFIVSTYSFAESYSQRDDYGCEQKYVRIMGDGAYTTKWTNEKEYAECLTGKAFALLGVTEDISINPQTKYPPLEKRSQNFGQTTAAKLTSNILRGYHVYANRTQLANDSMDLAIKGLKRRVNRNIGIYEDAFIQRDRSRKEFENDMSQAMDKVSKDVAVRNEYTASVVAENEITSAELRETDVFAEIPNELTSIESKREIEEALDVDRISPAAPMLGVSANDIQRDIYPRRTSSLEKSISYEKTKTKHIKNNESKKKAEKALMLAGKFAATKKYEAKKIGKNLVRYAQEKRYSENEDIDSNENISQLYERVAKFDNNLNQTRYRSDFLKREIQKNEIGLDAGQLERAQKTVDLSDKIVSEADTSFFEGDLFSGEKLLSIGQSLLDVGVDFIPGVGTGRDAYELFMGENMITGEELTISDRIISGLGLTVDVFTLGVGGRLVNGGVKSAIKVFKKIDSVVDLRTPKKVWTGITSLFDSAGMLGYKAQEQLTKFTEFVSYISKDQAGVIGNLNNRINNTADIASNAATRNKLFKQLATESQIGEKGTVIAGKGSRSIFRNAEHSARKYGGNADDYVKKSSSSVVTPDGYKIETHWVENMATGKKYEPKTIMTQLK
jgi:hypothetical protein